VKSKFRQPAGAWGTAVKVLFILLPVTAVIYIVNVPFYLGLSLYTQQYVAVFMTLVLVLAFLTVKPTKTASGSKIPWYDIILSLASIAVGGYVAVFYPYIILNIGRISLEYVILGMISIVIVLEVTRRLVGLPILILAIIFIIYPFFSHLAPGILNTRQFPWQRVLTFLYLNPAGLIGKPAVIVSTIITSFILFGRFLLITGGGQFLTDFAMAAVGKFRGGPAKVSVVATAFFGMLSGSASANAATVGIITIPMMKKTGYPPHVAGAIEAAASTGGGLTPPVMSATAFLIAEFLQMPYAQIALAAAVPSLLYYVALFTQVDLEAVKNNLKGVSSHELPSLKNTIKQGWFFVIPIGVLCICLFYYSLPPAPSALYATASVFLVSFLKKEIRVHTQKLLNILEETGRGMLEIAIISLAAGFIIGSIALTGLGINLSTSLVTIAGANTFFLLLLAAIACIVLGMGMPIIAIYIVVVVLIGPALVELGVKPLAAHLFILYFGAMSFTTPPVCIAVYVAAAIAQAGPMRTGFAATRLAIAAYLVPFVFAFSPALLLMESAKDFAMVFIPTTLGIMTIAIALSGHLFSRLHPVERIWASAAGLAMLIPDHFICNGTGLVLAVLFVLWHRKRKKS